jgi:flagellar biosynthetic protein FlhB
MPDQDKHSRTEAPTPKKRKKEREKGNVARSMDVNSVVVLIAGILVIKFMGENLLSGISHFTSGIYTTITTIQLTPESTVQYTQNGIWYIFGVISPILITIMILGLASNFGQVGFFYSKKALVPKFSKINPLKGVKRIFSSKSLVELVKGIVKITIIATIGYSVIKNHINDYYSVSIMTPGAILSFIAEILFELSVKIAIVLIFLAAADYAWQNYDYEKNIKMTKQEVKEEQRQERGNPEVKGRVKSLQRQLSRTRMMNAVPDATVVVTNPTHIAVALQYAPNEPSDAPKVLAKGQRKTAERIKLLAKENNIPIIEDKPLARTLFQTLEVGMEIPPIFYQAVAEVLAKVFQMQRKNPNLKNTIAYG